MRIYANATIQEEKLTGFQSPCSEFAEKPLSLDEKLNVGDPSLYFVQSAHDFPLFGVQKHDWLLIDLARRPGPKSLVVSVQDDEVIIFKGGHQDLEEVRIGVVRTVIRDFR